MLESPLITGEKEIKKNMRLNILQRSIAFPNRIFSFPKAIWQTAEHSPIPSRHKAPDDIAPYTC